MPRGRPDGLLSDVVIRGAEAHGRGFVSGHAATLTALAAVAWPWLGRRGRIAVAVLVVVVCLTRVYVGAHLPLDVVGGAGAGPGRRRVRPAAARPAGLMLVDSRRGLLVSGGLLAGAAVVTVLYVLPATRRRSRRWTTRCGGSPARERRDRDAGVRRLAARWSCRALARSSATGGAGTGRCGSGRRCWPGGGTGCAWPRSRSPSTASADRDDEAGRPAPAAGR